MTFLVVVVSIDTL